MEHGDDVIATEHAMVEYGQVQKSVIQNYSELLRATVIIQRENAFWIWTFSYAITLWIWFTTSGIGSRKIGYGKNLTTPDRVVIIFETIRKKLQELKNNKLLLN